LKNTKVLVFLNSLAFISTVVVNGLANALPLNGRATGAISDSYPNLFVPAGFTFAIWGVIYLLQLGFVLYQFMILIKGWKSDVLKKIGYLFCLSAIANIGWIFAWHWEFLPLSLVLMALLLFTLLRIYLLLDIPSRNISRGVQLFIHLPVSVYLGWITVASIANITAFLVGINWQGFGIDQQIWAVLVIIVAVLLAGMILYKRHDFAYGCVVIWSLYGIWYKRSSTFSLLQDSWVEIASLTGMILLIVWALFIGYKSWNIRKS